MVIKRKGEDRGRTQIGWLDGKHSFSFGDYFDPKHNGFGPLRVINEDLVQPGTGFSTHPHKDMEIITYVLEGQLEHKDSMGNGSLIRAGEVQYMSAGFGVTHSEFNPSNEEKLHLFQIWIQPNRKGGAPSYDQRHIDETKQNKALQLVVSGDGRNESIRIHQNVDIYLSRSKTGQQVAHSANPGRKIWVQVARGELDLNGTTLEIGDGAAVENEKDIRLTAREDSEALLFDMA